MKALSAGRAGLSVRAWINSIGLKDNRCRLLRRACLTLFLVKIYISSSLVFGKRFFINHDALLNQFSAFLLFCSLPLK